MEFEKLRSSSILRRWGWRKCKCQSRYVRKESSRPWSNMLQKYWRRHLTRTRRELYRFHGYWSEMMTYQAGNEREVLLNFSQKKYNDSDTCVPQCDVNSCASCKSNASDYLRILRHELRIMTKDKMIQYLQRWNSLWVKCKFPGWFKEIQHMSFFRLARTTKMRFPQLREPHQDNTWDVIAKVETVTFLRNMLFTMGLRRSTEEMWESMSNSWGTCHFEYSCGNGKLIYRWTDMCYEELAVFSTRKMEVDSPEISAQVAQRWIQFGQRLPNGVSTTTSKRRTPLCRDIFRNQYDYKYQRRSRFESL